MRGFAGLTMVLTLALALAPGGATLAEDGSSEPFRPAFYAFRNGVSFGALENEARTLKDLGYDGVSQVYAGGEKLAERIAAYDSMIFLIN